MTANQKRTLKTVLIYIGVPLITFLLFFLIILFKGMIDGSGSIFLFKEGLNDYNFTIFLQNLVFMGLIAFAVSMNVPNGRFDFSVGSTMVLSCIVGGNLALRMGGDSFTVFLMFIVFGAIFGAICGALYVLLRLPAMVTSLGVTLIFEGLAVNISSGTLTGVTSMYMADQWILLLVYLLSTLLVFYLFGYTKFGHDKRSLMGGQKIAVNTGINEKKNAIICYILCGIFSAMAGMVVLKQQGSITASLNLGTLMTMFQGFLALFIGQYLAKFGNFVWGIFVGAIVSALISSFLGALQLTSQMQNIVNALILLFFLIFQENSGRIMQRIKMRKLKTHHNHEVKSV